MAAFGTKGKISSENRGYLTVLVRTGFYQCVEREGSLSLSLGTREINIELLLRNRLEVDALEDIVQWVVGKRVG
jgi:hypothetical protein